MKVHTLSSGCIYEGDWLEAPLEPGFTLAILDGPFGLNMADWDRMKLEELSAWYAPHIARVTALSAASSSMYVWNTQPGAMRLDPMIRSFGWDHRATITWDKTIAALAGRIDTAKMRTWPDTTETCLFYQREELTAPGGPAQFIAYAAGASEGNTIRKWLYAERARAGLSVDRLYEAIEEAGGKAEMICRHSFTESQWCLPTFDQWKALHIAWNRRGRPEGRPYLQRDNSRVYDLASEADHEQLRAEYEQLRAEYEQLRAPFSLPTGASNVWTSPLVGGSERLKAPNGEALHCAQKPIEWAERMILASTRPGEKILVPFGGTCREAVFLEHLARTEPEKARRFDACELNQDPGRDYIGAALAQIRGQSTRRQARGQVSLFGQPPHG